MGVKCCRVVKWQIGMVKYGAHTYLESSAEPAVCEHEFTRLLGEPPDQGKSFLFLIKRIRGQYRYSIESLRKSLFCLSCFYLLIKNFRSKPSLNSNSRKGSRISSCGIVFGESRHLSLLLPGLVITNMVPYLG